MEKPPLAQPKKKYKGDVKLLRLEIAPPKNALCSDLGIFWDQQLPESSLSPKKAAHNLGVSEWDDSIKIQRRFQKLMERYPRDIFQDRYLAWQPSYELLADVRVHYNWYWLRGVLPGDPGEECSEVKFLTAQDCIQHWKQGSDCDAK